MHSRSITPGGKVSRIDAHATDSSGCVLSSAANIMASVWACVFELSPQPSVHK